MSAYSENLIREVISYVAKNGSIKSYSDDQKRGSGFIGRPTIYSANNTDVVLISAGDLHIIDEVEYSEGDDFYSSTGVESDRSISVNVVFHVFERARSGATGATARESSIVEKRGVATVGMSFAEVISVIAGEVTVTF